MGKYTYSDSEKKINTVLKYQDDKLAQIDSLETTSMEDLIASSETLLSSLGYSLAESVCPNSIVTSDKEITVPSWDALCAKAEAEISGEIELESLFTPQELAENSEAVQLMNAEFNELYKLDKYDYAISAIAGIVAGAIDILMVGIPHVKAADAKEAPLSDFIRKQFEKSFPPDKIKELEKISKVPYDAQDNRYTKIRVEGLSAYYHRLLSLGHDPLLGFVVGVLDIMSGNMTTIDKNGKLVVQAIDIYQDRKEATIVEALIKQIHHLKSDVATSMSLPVPLMSLFNFLQIGNIGEEKQTIAEIVQGMYYEGYDFVHFCTMSIPTMIAELIVRIGYFYKKRREGCSVKESLPVSPDRIKNPKLGTMLFIAHSAATAINAGKVKFTGDPCAINYPQWMAFAKHSYEQVKWWLYEKPERRDEYVSGKIYEQLDDVLNDVNKSYNRILGEYTIILE